MAGSGCVRGRATALRQRRKLPSHRRPAQGPPQTEKNAVNTRPMETNIFATAVALSDKDLLARIDALATTEREATAELLAPGRPRAASVALPRAGLRLALRVLHAGAPPLRGRRLQPHQGGPGLPAVPDDPRPPFRGCPEPDRGPVAGTAPHSREP